jgi:L-ascorbate metabolism protein UlaG (beta-lactamase superfamily)
VIEPIQKDEQLLADIASANVKNGFAIWWLGQSGFLLKCEAGYLLFDPYLSDSLTKKYAQTDKPHVRISELIVDPARLDFIDVVTSSHNHTDHLDAETLKSLIAANPALALVIPEANRQFVAQRLNIDSATLVGLSDGETAQVEGFVLRGITAAHETVDRDEQGRCHYMGYAVQFGEWSVYHSGDTMLHEGLVEQLAPLNIDVAILPINGRKAERRVAGNLSGVEAARLASDIGARTVVPCHYEMFTFNTEPPDAFVAECDRLGQNHSVLKCGQRLDSYQLPPAGTS